MAEIREKLVLEDQFSANQSKYVSGMEKAAQKTVNAQNAMGRATQAAKQMSGAAIGAAKSQSELQSEAKGLQAQINQLDQAFNKAMDTLEEYQNLGFTDDWLGPQIAEADRLAEELAEVESQYQEVRRQIDGAGKSHQKMAQSAQMVSSAQKQAAQNTNSFSAAAKKAASESKKSSKGVKGLVDQLKQLSKANPAAQLNRQFMRLAATLFSVSRILSFMKSSMEAMPDETQESWKRLKDSVTGFFQSGISYLLNGMLPGMEKLNQALNSPAGQQFAAVFRELANEAGKAIGKILSGLAWIVTQMGNDFQSMRGITGIVIQGFQMMGDAVQWVKSNWATLAPIIQAVVAAVLAYKAVALVAATAQAVLNGALSTSPWVLIISLIAALTQVSGPLRTAILAVAAAVGILNLVLNGNPIILIITAIGWLVTKIYDWVQSVGGLQIAWLIALDAIKTGWDYFVAGLNVGIAWVQNLIDSLIIMWSEASTAVANFVGDMKVNVLTILQNMVNGAIDIINNFISALNNIPGVNLETVKHFTFATEAALENEAQKQARGNNLAATKAEIAANRAQRDKNLNKMFEDAAANHQNRQAEIIGKQMENAAKKGAEGANDAFMNQYGDPMIQSAQDTASGVGGSLGSDVSAIKKEVAMSEEELQSLVDLAQRQYINEINLTAQSPVINVQGQNTGNSAADSQALADAIRDILIEQSSAGTYRSTARVY